MKTEDWIAAGKPDAHPAGRIVCLEDGRIFTNTMEAASVTNGTTHGIKKSCTIGYSYKGLHFMRYDEWVTAGSYRL
jgi:hypothetical protein